MRNYMPPHIQNRRRCQAGVTLFLTLIALVGMTLAAIAMMRSIDTGNIIAGNLALKQGASHEADKGINVAFNCMDGGLLKTVDLRANNATCNYYATLQPDVNRPFGIPDILETAPETAGLTTNAITGNKVTFVIERMCAAGTVAFAEATCITSPFGRKEEGGDGHLPPKITAPQALYRISVKVAGPRSVATYTQMVMNATQ